MMSLPEVLLWRHLRGSPSVASFRRQHPIGPYIVDFYCAAARLAIEIDGATHDHSIAADVERQRFLATNGFRLIRIPATDVLRDPARVADALVALAARPLHRPPAAAGPPPRAGEELGCS